MTDTAKTPAPTTTNPPAAPAVVYKPAPGENTKKTVSATLEAAFLRLRNHLMDADPRLLKRFNQVCDRMKREIMLKRESDSSLKRVYPVEIETKVRVLHPLLNTKSAVSIESLASADESQGWLSILGYKLRDTIPTLLQKELPIISLLNEEEMRKNVYLGVNQAAE